MAEGDCTAVVLALCAGAVLAVAVEQGLKPAPRALHRPVPAWLAHAGVWVSVFGLVFAVTARPVFSALLMLAEMVFIVLVSNAKRHSLREPFVFADLEYFVDALRHPRLFLPYFSVWGAGLTLAVFGLVLFLGLKLEVSFRVTAGYPAFLGMVAALLIAGVLLLWMATTRALPVSFDADGDLRRCGLLACFWFYAVAERKPVDAVLAGSPFLLLRSSPSVDKAPHLVIIQSESYFDARRLYPQVHPAVYAQFDAMRRDSVQHGLLQVPAWGGNTTRSEFAFLSGLSEAALGVHRFNPHRRLARRQFPNMAGAARAAGYQTVCVHPYPVQFNSRDKVYPVLGFERFIDLTAFAAADRCGPYVSDAAVTASIAALLRAATRPMLLFVITMENHGPLHLERPAPGDVERLYASPPPPEGYDDFSVYLRHIANADHMIGAVRSEIESSGRDGLLCWYGDHVPILPTIYGHAGFEDGRTDYCVWGPGVPGDGARRDLPVDALAAALLRHAGFEFAR